MIGRLFSNACHFSRALEMSAGSHRDAGRIFRQARVRQDELAPGLTLFCIGCSMGAASLLGRHAQVEAAIDCVEAAEIVSGKRPLVA